MRYTHRATLAAALLATVSFAIPQAQATLLPAGSEIDFYGALVPVGSANSYDPATTGIDFKASGQPTTGAGPGTIGMTSTATGAFTAFNAFICPAGADGGCGTIANLQAFNSATNTLITPTLPIPDFLTFTQSGQHVTFDLTSFSIVDLQPVGAQDGVTIISGNGILDYAGYDQTIGNMTITSQGPGNTSWSGTLISQELPVPEPASMLLLGVGVIGLVAARKRFSLS